MQGEIMSLETAQKIRIYNRLLLERKNVIRFLKNQIELNNQIIEKKKEERYLKEVIMAQNKIDIAKDMLKLYNVK